MGLDLTLLPARFRMLDGFHGYDRLGMHRDPELFDQILALPSLELHRPLDWYGDEGIESLAADPYGNVLRFCQAGDLGRTAPAFRSTWNEAVLAFIRALPPETEIVLWWH